MWMENEDVSSWPCLFTDSDFNPHISCQPIHSKELHFPNVPCTLVRKAGIVRSFLAHVRPSWMLKYPG